MLPSPHGRIPSGSSSTSLMPSRIPQNQLRSAFSLAHGDRTSQQNSSTAQIQPGSWLYPQPATSSSANKTTHRPNTTSSTSMIGPTSSFYDPDDVSHHQRDSHTAQYQQWIEAFGTDQRFNYDPTQQSYPREQPEQHQLNGHFGYQYTPPLSSGRYAESTTGTVTQANFGTQSQYPQRPNDAYPAYYSNILTSSNGSADARGQIYHTPTPESTSNPYPENVESAFSRTQQHQFQQIQQHHPTALSQQPQSIQPHSQQQKNYPPTAYDPDPDHRTISPNSNQSSVFSSLSPESFSWVEDSNGKHNRNGSTGLQRNSGDSPGGSGITRASTIPGTSTSGNAQNSTNPVPAIINTNRTQEKPGGGSRVSPNVLGSSQGSANTPVKPSTKRKRAKKDDISWTVVGGEDFGGGESDSDSDDDEEMGGGISVGMGGFGVGGKRRKGSRLPGACSHCKKLKMKCDFPKNDDTCKRCKAGGHACIVEGRKPRTAPNKREYLLAQIRQKDAIIESLLKQLHNPYIATPMSIASYRMATSPSDHSNRNILAWLDRLQSSVRDNAIPDKTRSFLEPRNINKEDNESDDWLEARTYTDGNVCPGDDDNSGDTDSSLQDADNLQSSLPDSHVPLGLIANLSLSGTKAKSKRDPARAVLNEEDLNDDNVGVANETYFMPGPATDLGIRATLIEQHSPPEIIVHGLVVPEDVERLFEIFYKKVNPFINLLDPVLHTPASTFARCPFLFTVVCAISSRYYTEKSEIYPIAMHFAKHSAANALIDGWKSVELCQAYILMSIYAVPARRWEEDRSWLYTGLAIRIATDLNLHQVATTKPQNEKQEREILNRARVWMICFNLDRSTATQFGKPSTIKEDYFMRNAKDWYKNSKYNLPYDIHLCAHSALLQIVAKFHDEIFSDLSSPSGLNKQVDFRKVTMIHDEHLTQYHEEWSKRFQENSDPNDPSCTLRCSLLPFLVNYSRLVMFSFGFQQAFRRGIEERDYVFFNKCLDAAKTVIRNMVELLAPSGYMRYAPDGHFVFSSFASAFLLKLLRPEFSSMLPKDEENEIFDLIGRLIQTLSSPKIAIDDRHTPKLYARFLAGLLSRHRRDGATVGRLHPQPQPQNVVADLNSSNAHMTTFSVSQQHQGGAPSAQNPGLSHTTVHATEKTNTPIYTPEATFAAGTGQIHFGSDLELAVFGSGGFSDEEMLATMQAIKNPAWWQNMMMPGFSWPEASPSPPAMATMSQGPGFPQGMNMPLQNHSTGFGMYGPQLSLPSA